MDSNKLNSWLKNRKSEKAKMQADSLFKEISAGNRVALSKGITLLESTLISDQEEAEKLIQMSLPHTGNSLRIGITGVPGVGKSSFIETFGLKLIELGKKVAVLAIDPSSEETKGSILGDKTRMEQLSIHPNAFIRPTSSGSMLGGVARKTRESTYLCELAGFDIIIIETVGVGQSETMVHSMVDFFLLLMLAGAGDELQGIKRGIMEMSDLLVITKADGTNIHNAKNAKNAYRNALHLFPPKQNNWITKTALSSIFELNYLDEICGIIFQFQEQMSASGHLSLTRKNQDIYWFEESLKNYIVNHFYQNNDFKTELNNYKNKIKNNESSSFDAAKTIFNKYINGRN